MQFVMQWGYAISLDVFVDVTLTLFASICLLFLPPSSIIYTLTHTYTFLLFLLYPFIIDISCITLRWHRHVDAIHGTPFPHTHTSLYTDCQHLHSIIEKEIYYGNKSKSVFTQTLNQFINQLTLYLNYLITKWLYWYKLN